ncbi:thioredoxin family protein [Rhizobium sp. TRM95111]|uniref:DUF1223 domain-containing protein n=1 Tax=Rhizobium alarense TaxID=2846851 RepID=UPI001F47021A|nr:thioredoxin family protein [Rhizobium alarense]MCF3641323.1 thioredoxin family protein [Rhizobium alarense]
MPNKTLLAGLIVTIATVSGAVAAIAGDGRAVQGVVELFTSQGCSSCPPADKALEALAREGDVVALAYHVDYWNYLGWADTMSSKGNTERQYAYARMFGRNSVYTPQAVLNGREHLNGGNLKGIRNRIDGLNAEGKGLKVPVSAGINQDEIRIRVGPGEGKATIVVAYFDRERSVEIADGENRGRTVNYWHAVTDIETIGMWEGKETNLVLPAAMLAKKENGGCAILVQRMRSADTPGAILGATVLLPEKLQEK